MIRLTESTNKCLDCNGSGEIYWHDFWGIPQGGECPTCKGTGKLAGLEEPNHD